MCRALTLAAPGHAGQLALLRALPEQQRLPVSGESARASSYYSVGAGSNSGTPPAVPFLAVSFLAVPILLYQCSSECFRYKFIAFKNGPGTFYM